MDRFTGRANLYLSMDVNEMERNNQLEEKLDAIADRLSQMSYWIVISTTLSLLLLFILMFSGDFVGITYHERDVIEWCDEYHPTWTYDQCNRMVGR